MWESPAISVPVEKSKELVSADDARFFFFLKSLNLSSEAGSSDVFGGHYAADVPEDHKCEPPPTGQWVS
jgi:hypothetical protein